MRDLKQILHRKRERRGSIDFDLPEPVIEFDDLGLMKSIARSERNIAHRLIEEFMLSANETVAHHLESHRIASLYRIHEKPDAKRVYDFETIAATFGYSLGVGALPIHRVQMKTDRRANYGTGKRAREIEIPKEVHITPRMYQKLTEKIAGKPEERILSYLMLRSLKQARYSEENLGHFALAAPTYTHFTSPIRRYPDLIVHRALSRLLAARRPFPSDDFEARNNSYEELGRESSERERRAETAERESLLWKKIVFLRDKIGRTFDAYVSGVAAFGLFVTLSDYLVEGLVSVSTLTDDFYVYDEKGHRLRGRSSGKIFRLGDPIRVKLVAIDEVQRRVDFRPETSAGTPRRKDGP
jgi:ribonuclease R